jgi:cytochrome c oxidase cbb3-type subunit 4
VVFIAFISVVLWAYSSKRKSNFDEAANLPFADDPKPSERDEKSSRSNNQ